MADSRERRGYNQGFHRLLTLDLDDRVGRQEEPQNVPQKITEERIRTEWERGASVRNLDSAPLLIERPAAPQPDAKPLIDAELSRATPRAPSDPRAPSPREYPKNRPAQTGSILRLDEAPPAAAPRPSGTWKLQRKPRRSWRLWTAVLVLSLALAGVVAYGYLAVRGNGVNLSELPGAATVRTLRSEAASARLAFEQSGFYRESAALGHGARPALAASSHRVEQAAGWIRDRYKQWRARH